MIKRGFMRRGVCCFAAILLLCASHAQAAEIAKLSTSDSVRQDTAGTFPSAILEDADLLVAESDTLRLYMNEESKLFKIEDKRNGYLYSSGRNDEQTSSLSRKWQAYAQSPCAADFITLGNMNTFSETPDAETMTMERTENGLVYRVSFPKGETTLSVYIALEGDSLVVSVPDDEIQSSNPSTELSRLSVLPFLGAAFVGEGDGYIFMPDGAGALIHFDAPTGNRALTLRAYGQDRSLVAVGEKIDQLSTLPTKSAEHATLPVMGIALGGAQNAFVIWPESGEEYCDFMASPAGNNNLSCYYACVQGVYREIYQQPSSGSESFVMAQSKPNRLELKLRYTFLSGGEATYVGMANAYRDYLEACGEIPPVLERNGGGIPLLLDCLMEESEKAMIGEQSRVMTRYEDVRDWAETLLGSGVERLILSLEGTAHGGISRSRYNDMRADAALGDPAVLDELRARDVAVLTCYPFLKFYGDQLSNDSRAYAITRRFITSVETSYLDQESYYLRLPALPDLTRRALEEMPDGVASDDLGQYLFSGYQSPDDYTRPQALEMIREALDAFSEAGIVALAQPGAYALKYIDLAYDIPLSHSAMTYETDAVPFVQIVYSGRIPAFGRSQAAGGNSMRTLLRMIDFNLYPHYTMTQEETALLAKTNSSGLFATRAEDLLAGAAEEYALLNRYLGPVYGERILSRHVPQDGVSVVTYQSGARIIVNYQETDYEYDGHAVPALSALLIEGEEAR